VEQAFSVEDVRASEPAILTSNHLNIELGAGATPYRFTFSQFFPRPDMPRDNPLTEEGVELGRRLFLDTRLSANHAQSCASCHRPGAAFSDDRPVSRGADGAEGTRNAMPLLNLAWKSSFFWDGRAATLREQVLQPITNPVEMHETLSNVTAKLAADPEYPAMFARAFGPGKITADRVARALEQFLLTRVSYDSKFDRVLNGQAKLTDEEQHGFELFHTEYDPAHGQYGADCFHCHGGPLFRSQDFANNGLDAEPADAGRGAVTGRAGDRGKFAVPSLRNVELTGPYMHDGRFQTLEEVVEHYCTGMKRSATLDPNLAKHPDGGVPLSAGDKRALVAFLKTLTDESLKPADAGQLTQNSAP
jgi:cytochrome c peroxidase